mgnify:CR=1 FL=1
MIWRSFGHDVLVELAHRIAHGVAPLMEIAGDPDRVGIRTRRERCPGEIPERRREQQRQEPGVILGQSLEVLPHDRLAVEVLQVLRSLQHACEVPLGAGSKRIGNLLGQDGSLAGVVEQPPANLLR